MANTTRVAVIINESSGGSKGSNPLEPVNAAFAKVGMTADIHVLSKSNPVDSMIRELAGRGDTTVVAGGGDGTISSVANAILGGNSKMKLALLPLGTLNHFTKDLRIPQEIEKAAHIIKEGYSKPVDVCEINGHYFINNSAIGVYPMVVLDREAQERKGGSKWPSLFGASLRALKKFDCMKVSVEMEGRRSQKETPLIFIGNDRYIMEGTEIGTRKRLDEGILTVLVTKKSSRLHLITDALLAFFGGMREAKNLDLSHVRELTITLNKPETNVSLDGEVKKLKSPLVYRSVPNAIEVIVPQNPEPV